MALAAKESMDQSNKDKKILKDLEKQIKELEQR